jgi:hypothetical protein
VRGQAQVVVMVEGLLVVGVVVQLAGLRGWG